MKINHGCLCLVTVCLSFLLQPVSSYGQAGLQEKVKQYAQSMNGNVGVYAILLETGDTVAYKAGKRFPMQSVYKFPIAMAVLDKVDQGELHLEQQVHILPSDFIPIQGYSPIREKFPEGVDLTVRELLRYSVAESDGSASDMLLKVIGGIQHADHYIHDIGIKEMAIAITERVQVVNDTIQYQNWATPKSMTNLLKIFYDNENLSEKSHALLLKDMTGSKTGLKRLKGLLPPGTIVAHKTGTSATYNGLTRATNDVGIITLPDGKHVAISVFISDSYASQTEREQVIAKITKAVFDDWGNS